jgi:two-component sensor histidine kinase
MNIPHTWKSIINAGVGPGQTHAFSDKLKTRNKLSVFCALFSLIYVAFFTVSSLYLPLAAIITGILLFVTSVILNRFKKYTLSSLLILINTNYCVLFFSIYLGFNSGIHLYLFTSPLIVLTSFDTTKLRTIFLAMLSYILNFILITLVVKHFNLHFIQLTESVQNAFYLINLACSGFILITLSLYLLSNNNKVNQLLIIKHKELIHEQEKLLDENRIRKEAENSAKESLAQREVLLSEIHHRVKNNLAVVNGLMELQSVYIKDERILNVIKESQNRVKSIALLHEKLYQNKTFKEVGINSYIDELIHFIRISQSGNHQEIKISADIEDINLEMTRAMPFALLVNELISNSYKHAFKTKNSGEIFITFTKNKNRYVLAYSDNGIGFEYTDNIKNNSLGLNLIETFSKQLNGEFEFFKGETMMEFKLQFV